MKPIIRVENISKRYLLGASQTGYSTVRESLMSAVKFPLKAFRRNGASANGDNILWALKDVGFEVFPGEVVGIIGRNGAGKSTLLKILSRITEPTSGKIELFGRVGSLLEVGTGFHPELTGRENIFLNGAILGMRQTEIAKKFDEIVDFAEIEKFIDTPVKFYSSGMYTRLAFAVAANLEPEILIVDEVLAVGDSAFQKKCLGKMKSVSDKEGRTVLFVSHNMTAVQSLCTRGVLMRGGQVAATGATQDVINAYSSKDFVGESIQEWNESAKEAPGNEFVRFTRIAVAPRAAGDEINVETPVDIEFEFQNLMSSEVKLNLSLVLWSIAGDCIFNVATPVIEVGAGAFRGVCSIPGNLLNDNKYSVEIYVVKDESAVVFRQADIAFFEVADTERAGKWYGKWIGAVRPKLDFRLDKVETNA